MDAAMREVTNEFAKRVDRMDALSARACLLLSDGDRVRYFLKDQYEFNAGANEARDLNLNNPMDAVFYGTRLDLYLAGKLSTSEKAFRPLDWTCVGDWDLSPSPDEIIVAGDVSGTVSIRTPRGSYTNKDTALDISNTFSQRYGTFFFGSSYAPCSAYLGGLDFHKPERIKRGESLVVRFNPNFSYNLTVNTGAIYRVTAVLHGYKIVHAFK